MLRPIVKDETRRNFLRIAPCAAAVTLALNNMRLFASPTPESQGAITHEPFQIWTAKALDDAIYQLQLDPGNKMLFQSKTLPFAVTLTVEKKTSAKEFEYHEHRDHIFQILKGTTLYEVGGTPKHARSTGPGEWLAPISEGSTAITMHKGDMLIVPRGTPHKRTTKGSVTLILISPMGALL